MRLGKKERQALRRDQDNRKRLCKRARAEHPDYARSNLPGAPRPPRSVCAALWPKGQMCLQWGHTRKWGSKVTVYE